MGGGETVSGDKDGVHPTVHVPIGWQRRVEGGQVIYVRLVDSVALILSKQLDLSVSCNKTYFEFCSTNFLLSCNTRIYQKVKPQTSE